MRELSLRLIIAFVICIGCGILFGYVAAVIGNGNILNFDQTIITVVQGWEVAWLTTVMQVFTWIGSAYVVTPITIIACALLYFKFNKRPQAFLFAVVIVGTVIFNALLKVYFKRERPEIYRIMDANGFSFPSGHTMMAFSLYVILGYLVWRNLKAASGRFLTVLFVVFMTLIIGTSRIYLGVHFPSDIIGGLLASGLWVTIAITTYAIYQQKHKNRFTSFN